MHLERERILLRLDARTSPPPVAVELLRRYSRRRIKRPGQDTALSERREVDLSLPERARRPAKAAVVVKEAPE
jgi:hypothetical protein